MIEGLKIDLSSDELMKHLAKRADHHKERATWYQSRAKELNAAIPAETNVTGDPVQNLRQHAETHKRRHTFFRLLADHIIPNETYRLTEGDLANLEFYSRYI